MRSPRHLAALTLAAAICATAARDGRAATVEGHFEPGLLIGRGFPLIDVRPTFGGDVTTWWSPLSRVGLGLESGMAVTQLPYGSSDGEPSLGKSGVDSPNTREDVTLLPRMMFGSRILLPADTWIGAFVGTTFIMSGILGGFSLIPYPTGSVAVETRFGRDRRYGVRAAFGYTHYWFGGERALMTSTLAFTWGTH